jgi:hypothetical protein
LGHYRASHEHSPAVWACLGRVAADFSVASIGNRSQTLGPIVFSFVLHLLQVNSCGMRVDQAARSAVTPAASPMATAWPVTRLPLPR